MVPYLRKNPQAGLDPGRDLRSRPGRLGSRDRPLHGGEHHHRDGGRRLRRQ